MTQDTIQQIREEFIAKFTVWNDGFRYATLEGKEEYPTPDMIADWWIEKSLSIATTAREEEQARIKAAIKRLWQHVPQGGISEMISHGTLVSRKEVLGIITNNKT